MDLTWKGHHFNSIPSDETSKSQNNTGQERPMTSYKRKLLQSKEVIFDTAVIPLLLPTVIIITSSDPNY